MFSGYSYGGAVCVEGGTVNMTGTSFTGTTSSYMGGALFVNKGTVTANNCTFTNNSAQYGGALHVEGVGFLKLENSSITGATATTRGGAVHVYNASTSSKQTFEMINTNITNCTAPDGGGIACFGCSVTKITGGTISNCQATGAKGKGGGLYIYNSGYAAGSHVVTVTDTVIENCSAAEAGNVHIQNTGGMKPNMVDFKNVTLRGGVATCPAGLDGFAGNIYVAGVDLVQNGTTYRCTVNLDGCTIEGGQSNYGGNVGVSGYSTVNITDTTIQNGTAAKGGGNLYLGNANALVNLYGTTQLKNGTCANGSNVRIGGGKLNVYNATIEGGNSSIYLNNGASVQLYVYDGIIRSTTDAKTIQKAGAGEAILKLYNCTAEGFDPTAFVADCSEAKQVEGTANWNVIHKDVEGATTNTATCTTAGEKTIVCETCAHTYVYDAPAAHTEQTVPGKEATCTEPGLTEGKVCSVCGETLVAQEPTKLAKHTEKTVPGKEATCTEPGLTEGKVCSVCGETLVAQEPTDLAEHTWGEPVNYISTCSVCGETKEVKPAFMITAQPEDTSVTAGEKATFTVAAEGVGVTYCWRYSRDGINWYNTTMEGAKTATLTVPALVSRNGYKYYCVLTDETGAELVSEIATLTVAAAELTVADPESVTVTDGDTAQFTVGHVDGYKYSWQYSRDGGTTWYETGMAGYNTATLSVPAPLARNGYQYRCVVSDGNGSQKTSAVATLTVEKQVTTITTQPAAATAENGTAVFSVVVEGKVRGYRWLYSRDGGTTWYETAMTGYNTDTLTVAAIPARDGYCYKVQITDQYGQVIFSDMAELTVN